LKPGSILDTERSEEAIYLFLGNEIGMCCLDLQVVYPFRDPKKSDKLNG